MIRIISIISFFSKVLLLFIITAIILSCTTVKFYNDDRPTNEICTVFKTWSYIAGAPTFTKVDNIDYHMKPEIVHADYLLFEPGMHKISASMSLCNNEESTVSFNCKGGERYTLNYNSGNYRLYNNETKKYIGEGFCKWDLYIRFHRYQQ